MIAEAARRGIICEVIIAVITSEMVTNELLSHGEVLKNGDAVRPVGSRSRLLWS